MSPPRRVTEMCEYLAVRSVVGLARALPSGAAQRFGALLGATADRLGARRGIVRSQIAAAFPERDETWVTRTTADCYRHFGREAAVMVRLRREGSAELIRRTTTDDATERWIERMIGGEGVIAVSGHLGNWEVGGAYLASRGIALAPVVKRQRNARFDAWLLRARRRLGMEPVYMADAALAIPRLLASGRTAVLLADQDARRRGLVVPFLGRPASTFRGPARLALATGAPLVFMSAVREHDWYRVRCEAVRDAPPGAAAAAGRGGDAAAPGRGAGTQGATELELTRRWVGLLERQVRESPAQYFWFHRRWKSGAALDRNDGAGGTVPNAAPAPRLESILTNREDPA